MLKLNMAEHKRYINLHLSLTYTSIQPQSDSWSVGLVHKFSCSVSLISLLPFCKFQLHKVKNMNSAIKANELGQKKLQSICHWKAWG